MNGLRITGHTLLWLGFLSAAFVTVRSTEIEGRPWESIEWWQYSGTLGVAVVGVVLLRVTARPGTGGPAQITGRLEDLQESLGTIVDRLHTMVSEWSPEEVYEIHGRIDRELAHHLSEFADGRQALVRAFGLRAYGQIMSDFASGERMVNRAWCASADGYADEVEKCLRASTEFLDAAMERINRLA